MNENPQVKATVVEVSGVTGLPKDERFDALFEEAMRGLAEFDRSLAQRKNALKVAAYSSYKDTGNRQLDYVSVRDSIERSAAAMSEHAVLGLDTDGHVIFWTWQFNSSFNSGETPEEWGIESLTESELGLVRISRERWEAAKAAHEASRGSFLNPAQRAILESYANGEYAYFLEYVSEEVFQADFAQRSGGLLKYLMSEMSAREGCGSREEAISRVDEAVQDLTAALASVHKTRDWGNAASAEPAQAVNG